MPAGLNQVASVIRFSYPSDDSAGGALPSGTVIYDMIDIRIEATKPTQVLLEQGLQVPTLYNVMMHEGNIEIKHNDQIHIVAPRYGFYYNKKFRVIGIQRDSNHPFQDRNQIKLIVRRWEESHSNDLQ